jgi:hypothetical protein
MQTVHSDAEVETLVRQVLAGTFPAKQWDTAAHLIVATWVMAASPQLNAETEIPRIIRAYNNATGVANTDSSGYHETMTLANLHAIGSVLAGLPVLTPVHAACQSVLSSRFRDKRWIFQYWSPGLMMSSRARMAWVEPDLMPLTFEQGSAS